jgi:hypothetical protein
LNRDSAIYQLCGLESVTSPLLASVFSSVKWGNDAWSSGTLNSLGQALCLPCHRLSSHFRCWDDPVTLYIVQCLGQSSGRCAFRTVGWEYVTWELKQREADDFSEVTQPHPEQKWCLHWWIRLGCTARE